MMFRKKVVAKTLTQAAIEDILLKSVSTSLGLTYAMVTLNSSLLDFGADSLDLVELQCELEEHFGFDIDLDIVGDWYGSTLEVVAQQLTKAYGKTEPAS